MVDVRSNFVASSGEYLQKFKKAISKKTKWIILNSPSNPTGSSYTKSEIKELAKK